MSQISVIHISPAGYGPTSISLQNQNNRPLLRSVAQAGRQDWLRPSCALPRGRCQAEKPRPDEGALSFFCWRPFASGLAWTPTKKRLRLTSQPFLGLAERTRIYCRLSNNILLLILNRLQPWKNTLSSITRLWLLLA